MPELKYYEFYLTGEIEVDKATGAPVKDAQGNIKVKFTRQTAPSKALLDAGLTSNAFFQCEAVEVNVEKDTLTSASGKRYDIGPMVNKGVPVNIFFNTQKEVYKAIAARFLAGKFTWIQKPEDGVPIIHMTEWALPGRVVEFGTGFDFYVMNRNKTTKALERLQQNSYNNKGELIKEDVIKNKGVLFLFANEVEAADVHIKNAIAALEEFKVPNKTNDAKEKVITAQSQEKPAESAEPPKI